MQYLSLARIGLLVGLVQIGLIAPVFGQQDVTPEQVNRAIARGIDFLKSKQDPNTGRWADLPSFQGGTTALAVLALLSCDVPPDDPRIVAALQYLDRTKTKETYVLSLKTIVYALVNPKKYYPIIRENAKTLIESRKRGRGIWSYGPGRDFGGDNSNTQFALLALDAAAEAGVKIPRDVWEECRRHWETSQAQGSGSWGYPERGATGSMTAAGIASLVITGRQLHSVRSGMRDGKPILCDGAREDRHLAAGIGWIARNFSVTRNPNNADMRQLHYYLYGLERAGRLSGERFFGDHDWYREGVRFLVRSQGIDGSWDETKDSGYFTVIDTAFALLFLSKGRIPILMNKLRYGSDNNWSKAPNDVHNMTAFMAKVWNQRVNWQVVDSQVARVEDLLQAPILQFSGHDAPQFTPKEKDLLRGFVEQGGYLVVDANCGVEDFDRGFRALCLELFPDKTLRRLDEGHAVWTSLFELNPTWPLYGLDVGCRTAIFYSPEDLSCKWEFADEDRSLPAFRVGANIIAYAAGPEDLQDKLIERKLMIAGEEDPIRRNFLQLAKIRTNGDWNLAPDAVRNLMHSLHEMANIDVVRQQRDIDLVDPNLVNYPLVYLHGRREFSLSTEEKERLADYLRNGGVLFADACCGSERFDAAFRKLLNDPLMLADYPLEPIPADHEIYTTAIGYDLATVQTNKGLGSRVGPPVLEGVAIEGRYVVIYSKFDIGCALEKQASSECKGYTYESAVKIASNIVLYALKQ